MSKKIALDFDGTLAHYDGYSRELGQPIPLMVERVKFWLKKGYEIKIFTARVSGKYLIGASEIAKKDAQEQEDKIAKWLIDNGLPAFKITAVKEHGFSEYWDDRAVGVELNTGKVRATENVR